jgi:SAM-dependent methyltransferase
VAETEFKYASDGAYHWSATYNRRLRRFDPRADARYEVPLALLREQGGLAAGQRGLDLGCGDGVMLYKVLRGGGTIVGVDLSRPGLAIARREIQERTGRAPALMRASATSLPLSDASVDYVLSIEVIEHVAEVEAYLGEIHRVLRPGGFLAVTTPHRLESGVLQDPYHVVEYDAASLTTLLSARFADVRVWGMYPSLLDRLYLGATRVKTVDKVVRGGFKLVAKFLTNPFQHALRESPPTHGWHNLVAIARR